MSLLEWIFIFELLVLFCAYIAWLAGRMVVRTNPNDQLHQFTVTFWRVMRDKPAPMKPVVRADDLDGGSGEEADLAALASGPAAQAEGGHVTAGAGGVKMATLNIKVVPNASRDQISGFLGKALKVHVSVPAEAGQANKAVIDLISATLGVRSHQVLLIRGHYQAQKVVQISGMPQSELDAKLEAFRDQ